MPDRYIHVEKSISLGGSQAELRDLVVGAIGLAARPQTCESGCGKLCQRSQVSIVPANVTCPPCRAYARQMHADAAAVARELLALMTADPDSFRDTKVSARQLQARATEHERLAAAYE